MGHVAESDWCFMLSSKVTCPFFFKVPMATEHFFAMLENNALPHEPAGRVFHSNWMVCTKLYLHILGILNREILD